MIDSSMAIIDQYHQWTVPSCQYHIRLPNFKVHLKDYIRRKINKNIVVKYLIILVTTSCQLPYLLNYGSVSVIIIIIIILLQKLIRWLTSKCMPSVSHYLLRQKEQRDITPILLLRNLFKINYCQNEIAMAKRTNFIFAQSLIYTKLISTFYAHTSFYSITVLVSFYHFPKHYNFVYVHYY